MRKAVRKNEESYRKKYYEGKCLSNFDDRGRLGVKGEKNEEIVEESYKK